MSAAPSGYEGKVALVTGAEGFTGSWLTERLLDGGATIVVPRGYERPDARFVEEGLDRHCELVDMDLLDMESVSRVLVEHGVEIVFHLAAQTVGAEADRSPLEAFRTNVKGTYNLLEACRMGQAQGTIPRAVIASSSHVYGMGGGSAHAEDAPLRPIDPYDVSKGCADMIARCYAVTYGLPVAVTRLANVYGGGDRNWSRIVPDSARALVRGERPVIRSDGSPEREYLYVEDAIDVYLTVADSLDSPEHYGRAWNAGMGEPISVLDLVRRLIAVSGKQLEPDVRGKGKPHAEADRLQVDSTAIQRELGWTPSWSLEEGLAKTYAWYEQRLRAAEPATVEVGG